MILLVIFLISQLPEEPQELYHKLSEETAPWSSHDRLPTKICSTIFLVYLTV
jgi:hypothetical protein